MEYNTTRSIGALGKSLESFAQKINAKYPTLSAGVDVQRLGSYGSYVELTVEEKAGDYTAWQRWKFNTGGYGRLSSMRDAKKDILKWCEENK